MEWRNLHEGPAEHGDGNHGQPARHLGETPDNVGDGDGKAVLLERAIEGVENALVRLGVLVSLLDVNLGDVGSGGVDPVQVDEADSRSGLGLIGKRSRDKHVKDRGRTSGPTVAEDGLSLAVDLTEVR